MAQHGTPFFFAVILYDQFLLVGTMQVHGHPGCVGLGVKLSADHVFIVADSHDRSFVWHVAAFFFNTQNFRTHLFDHFNIWLDQLVIPTINGIKRVTQISENWLVETIFEHVNGKDPKRRRMALGEDTYIIVAGR